MGVSSVVRTSGEYELAGWEFQIEFDVFAKFRIGCFLTTQKGGASALVSDLNDEKGREDEPFAARHQSRVFRGEQKSEFRNNEIETEQNVDLRLG